MKKKNCPDIDSNVLLVLGDNFQIVLDKW